MCCKIKNREGKSAKGELPLPNKRWKIGAKAQELQQEKVKLSQISVNLMSKSGFEGEEGSRAGICQENIQNLTNTPAACLGSSMNVSENA